MANRPANNRFTWPLACASPVPCAAPDVRWKARSSTECVFAASGFIIPASGPAQPKAILEWIRFNGDGTVFVAGATRSLNGVVAQIPGGGGGGYTVTDLVPQDGGCAGTLTFAPLTFDLFIQSKGEEKIWIIQTNPNNVFQGTATRVSR